MKSLYKNKKDKIHVNKRVGRFSEKKDIERLIELLNNNYSYEYLSKYFRCDIAVIKRMRTRLIKKGVVIKDLPENGGIKSGDVKRVRFTRLFRDKNNIKRAIFLINRGYTPGRISRILHCDRTSIISFRKRAVRVGFILKEFKKRPIGVNGNKKHWTETIKINKFKYPTEIINKGKEGYEEYLSRYKPDAEKIKKSNLEKARKTIRKVREKRIRDGIDEKDYGYLDYEKDYKIDWSNY